MFILPSNEEIQTISVRQEQYNNNVVFFLKKKKLNSDFSSLSVVLLQSLKLYWCNVQGVI